MTVDAAPSVPLALKRAHIRPGAQETLKAVACMSVRPQRLIVTGCAVLPAWRRTLTRFFRWLGLETRSYSDETGAPERSVILSIRIGPEECLAGSIVATMFGPRAVDCGVTYPDVETGDTVAITIANELEFPVDVFAVFLCEEISAEDERKAS